MAIYRNIHISFWQDSFVLDLTPDEKYFYLYLMTNSKTTQCGIYEIPLRVIELETGYSADKVFDLLHRFIGYKKILYNEETREIMLLNWIKYNGSSSPKVLTKIRKELSSIKNKQYAYTYGQVSIQYGYSIGTQPQQTQEQTQEETQEETQTPTVKNGVSENDSILSLINTYNVKVKGVYQLEQLVSFAGVVDPEVIEACIKQSEGKSVPYVISVIERHISEGKTTKASLTPIISANRTSIPNSPKEFVPDPELLKWVKEANAHVRD